MSAALAANPLQVLPCSAWHHPASRWAPQLLQRWRLVERRAITRGMAQNCRPRT